MKTRSEALSTQGAARPEPLATGGSNVFAHFSMSTRVPKIIDEVLERNSDYSLGIRRAVAELRHAIASGAPFPPLAFPAPDAAEWEPEWQERCDEGWLKSEWFFAECYVYRCLMQATRYFETGRDPFLPAKQGEIEGDRLFQGLEVVLDAGASEKPEERLFELLGAALWGNRVDLSYAVGTAFGARGTHADLLCDDRAWVVERLLGAEGDIHVVTDNFGSELAADFALADAVLSLSRARVTFDVKSHPIFVSDATATDVWTLLGALRARGGACRDLAVRLEQAFSEERLRIAPDGFWNGPRFLWQRPARLSRELDVADLLIFKGDANYRRVVGDAIWPGDATLADVAAYIPAPLVCLRTMKSDALAGISDERVAELDRADPEWRTNGRRGLIQAKRS